MKAEILFDRESLRHLVREVLAEEGAPQRASGGTLSPVELLDEETRRDVQEQVRIANKTYLTRAEAAKYLGVSEKSIGEWSKRPQNENPFPERNAGGEPRYKRTDIDEWAERERRRRTLKLAG
ncbi:MAG TPA: helix-turn-helix domain-containing protein [Pyrinomonadaceae bacterium]|jgi:predicted DNA-binding transcriptional regulator AlpA